MAYYVKRCRKCGAVNHPDNAQCQQCGEELPLAKIESDQPPPRPANGQPAAATTIQKPTETQKTIPSEDPSGYRPPRPISEVRIVDIQMPFLSMVTFMVKWALAAIPALIILLLIGAFLAGVLQGIGR